MLILRTLQWGPARGHGIACAIERASDDLRIDHGSLYPALQRLQQERWIAAAWGTSSNNRRAKLYRPIAAGRRPLHAESSRWERLVAAIGRVMQPVPDRFGADPGVPGRTLKLNGRAHTIVGVMPPHYGARRWRSRRSRRSSTSFHRST